MAKNQKNQGFAAIRDVVSSSRFRESRIIFGIDEKQNYKEVGVYDPQDIQKKINEQCLQMEPIVRPVMTVVDQSALEHYMTLYLEFKFVVRHMKNRIVYDTKVRLYLKNCGGCQRGTPGELIYRN